MDNPDGYQQILDFFAGEGRSGVYTETIGQRGWDGYNFKAVFDFPDRTQASRHTVAIRGVMPEVFLLAIDDARRASVKRLQEGPFVKEAAN